MEVLQAGTQESIKRQKVDEDKETAELQRLIEVVHHKEEVAFDAIPWATKPLSIVDYKIHKEGKKTYYQIIRVDGSSKMLVTDICKRTKNEAKRTKPGTRLE
ncbi:hypothetical protein Tco_1518641 [Tanacetum coccineum]